MRGSPVVCVCCVLWVWAIGVVWAVSGQSSRGPSDLLNSARLRGWGSVRHHECTGAESGIALLLH